MILTSTEHTSEDFKLEVRTIKFTLSGRCITNFTKDSLEATHLVNKLNKLFQGASVFKITFVELTYPLLMIRATSGLSAWFGEEEAWQDWT